MHRKWFIQGLFFVPIGLLWGCEKEAPVALETTSMRSTKWLLEKLSGSLPKHFSIERLTQLIDEGDLLVVSRYVNASLQTAIENPYLHLINGFIYEEMERMGDSSRVELAGIAYRSAYTLDHTNWLSAYLLGSYELRLQKYKSAQEHLAQALILRPNDPDILYALAYSSYYLGDIPVAFSSIEKATSLRVKDPAFHRAAAVISAAAARFNRAQYHQETYKKLLGEDNSDVSMVKQRIEEWKATHNKVMIQTTAQESSDNTSSDRGLAPNDMIGDLLEEALKDPSQTADAKPGDAASAAAAAGSDPVADAKKTPPSIVFDCYLLRTDDRADTTKGQNIMDSLQVLLGGSAEGSPMGPIASIRRTITGISGVPGASTGAATSISGGWQKIFNYSIYPVVMRYSLNIANARDVFVELIARPTIMTILGKPATFISGEVYQGVASGAVGAATASVDAGFKMEVKPTDILPDGRIFLDINITESLFIRPPVTAEGISGQMIGTTKGKITATVRAAFGQTVVIGGMYSRNTIRTKQGFPLLQDLPLLQYFFANETTQSLLTSTLYLVTPRQGGSIQECGAGLCQSNGDIKVREQLQERGLMAVGEYPNLYYILKYLANARAFIDFRSGDLLTPYWGYDSCSLREKIDQLSSFLFF